MEERKYFSVAFKKAVVKEGLSGKINKEQAKHKYGIAGNTAILNWIRKIEAEKIYGNQPRIDLIFEELKSANE